MTFTFSKKKRLERDRIAREAAEREHLNQGRILNNAEQEQYYVWYRAKFGTMEVIVNEKLIRQWKTG